MAECFACGQDMRDSDGCAEDRVIEFVGGETATPIPYGESDFDLTYEERIQSFQEDIDAGGRGKWDADRVRREMERFKARFTPEEYNNRRCHDCGVKIGEIHHPGCDMEECPRCGGQYFICDCLTAEKRRIWGPLDEQ